MIKNRKLEKCRFCNTPLKYSFCDLGKTPLSNSFILPDQFGKKEQSYPLHAYVCSFCFLVQLPVFRSPKHIFREYAYFSSYSDSWLKHVKTYVDYMIRRFKINSSSYIIEIASNDGYLLKYFKRMGVPVLGIEPAENVAEVAQSSGIPTLIRFFNTKTAIELVNSGKKADLLVGNNVLAHVPNLNDFVHGMKLLLKPQGVITLEFPHLLKLIEGNQFDTIYQEHFSYFSFSTVEKIFNKYDLTLFDVEELLTHGGSLRIFVKHAKDSSKRITNAVSRLRFRESRAGLNNPKIYVDFEKKVEYSKSKLLNFLKSAKREGKSVVGYGAPAKGNTLLNCCGIRTDLLNYTVDRSPYKQGRFIPGMRIPIYHPNMIKKTKPDYLLILPWNIKDEIIEQMSFVRDWGGKFVLPIPEVKIIP